MYEGRGRLPSSETSLALPHVLRLIPPHATGEPALTKNLGDGHYEQHWLECVTVNAWLFAIGGGDDAYASQKAKVAGMTSASLEDSPGLRSDFCARSLIGRGHPENEGLEKVSKDFLRFIFARGAELTHSQV